VTKRSGCDKPLAPKRENQMNTTRSAALAALVLVLTASLLSSTESQLQTDLSGVLTIDFFVDIFSNPICR